MDVSLENGNNPNFEKKEMFFSSFLSTNFFYELCDIRYW